MIQIYTGDGKGKTTAALGLAVRAAGANKKVRIVYFDKGGDNYNERPALDVLSKEFDLKYYATGLNRIGENNFFRFENTQADKDEAARAITLVEQIINEEKPDLIVLDELNTSLHLGLVEKEKVLDLLKKIPEEVEVVISGRYAAQELIELADLVSEIQATKHYFEGDPNMPAREGIDY